MIQRSASGTQTCHLFCNYAVRDLGCDSSSCCRARFPSTLLPLPRPLFPPRKREMYRAVTFPPLNPSEWAVPPWRTYRTNFAPVHDTARSLKGMKAVSVYVQPTLSVQLSRFIYRVARAELVSHSTIPYGPSHELPLVVDSREERSEGGRDRGNTGLSVTNYLNDRSRTSDLCLISEALFDDRSRAGSGWDTLVSRWAGLKELLLPVRFRRINPGRWFETSI